MFRGRFAIVTKEVCKEWINVSPQKIQSLLTSKIEEHENLAKKDMDIATSLEGLDRMLHELTWQALIGIISTKDICSLLTAVHLKDYPSAVDVYLDCLWVVGNEVESAETKKHKTEEWNRLCTLVKESVQQEIVSGKRVGEILEIDILCGAGLVDNPSKLKTKIVRTNTKILYTQRKYNLIKEETEGFSKVLCLLNEGVNRNEVDKALNNIYALIGYFDLEPNRVFDLVLEAFEVNPSNRGFLDLLSHYKLSSLPHMVGFKFQYYQRKSVMESKVLTPKSLYRLAALLISAKKLALDDLLAHLEPDLNFVGKAHQALVHSILASAKGIGTVNLSSKKVVVAERKQGSDNPDHQIETLLGETNQVYGLLQAFLEIGHWKLAHQFMEKLKQVGADPIVQPQIAKAVCQLVHELIEPLYRPLSLKKLGLSKMITSTSSSATTTTCTTCTTQKRSSGENGTQAPPSPSLPTYLYSKPVETSEDFFTDVLHILIVLGPYLHHDCLLFSKICRILKSMIDKKEIGSKSSSTTTRNTPPKACWSSFKKIICCSLLPSLSMISCNIGLVHELWAVLSLLPFSKRYSYYEYWRGESYKTYHLSIARAQTEDGTKKLLRRISNDTVKKTGRKIGKIAHSNPIVVFDTIFSQIEVYDNMIQPVVDALRFLTSFGFDVLSYTLICHLASDRSKLKEDGTNTSQWLSSLSQFCGCVYRKYPVVVELQGLLHYLIERLKCSQSIDLLVLAELLTKMGSCVSFEDVSETQLEARAGGRNLAIAVEMSVDPKLTNRRAMPKLRDALVKKQLVVPLLALIAQQRGHILYKTETVHMKLVGRLYDTSQMTLIQLCEFLETSVEPKNYQTMLPPLKVLCLQYKVDPDVAMRFCRPAIRAADSILGAFTEVDENKILSAESRKTSIWQPQSDSLLKSIQEIFPKSVLSPQLYCTFWSMKLCDVHFPRARYDAEVTSRNNMYKSISHKEELSESKRRKEHERHIEMISKLQREMNHQKLHTKRVLERLEESKDSFFPIAGAEPVNELIQSCIIPRILCSPEDALFCAKFMEILHSKDPKNFCSLKYYFDLTQYVPPLVLCCTEREAANLGVFLKETLALLTSWKSNTEFNDKAGSKRCFSISMTDATPLSFSKYKVLLLKVNQTMVDLYVKTLQSHEYMDIRNSLIVLTRLISVFPSSRSSVDLLAPHVDQLKDEHREDLKIMAIGYAALLSKQKTLLPEEKETKRPTTPLPPPAPPSGSSTFSNSTSSSRLHHHHHNNNNNNTNINNTNNNNNNTSLRSGGGGGGGGGTSSTTRSKSSSSSSSSSLKDPVPPPLENSTTTQHHHHQQQQQQQQQHHHHHHHRENSRSSETTSGRELRSDSREPRSSMVKESHVLSHTTGSKSRSKSRERRSSSSGKIRTDLKESPTRKRTRGGLGGQGGQGGEDLSKQEMVMKSNSTSSSVLKQRSSDKVNLSSSSSSNDKLLKKETSSNSSSSKRSSSVDKRPRDEDVGRKKDNISLKKSSSSSSTGGNELSSGGGGTSGTSSSQKRNHPDDPSVLESSTLPKRIRKEDEIHKSLDGGKDDTTTKSSRNVNKTTSSTTRSNNNRDQSLSYTRSTSDVVVEANTRRIEEEKKQRLKQKSANSNENPSTSSSSWGGGNSDGDDTRWNPQRTTPSRNQGSKGDRREQGMSNESLRSREDKLQRRDGDRVSSRRRS